MTETPKMISRQEVEDALNEFFEHDLVYKGHIQVFPNATYFPRGINGRKVLELYGKLRLENKVRE